VASVSGVVLARLSVLVARLLVLPTPTVKLVAATLPLCSPWALTETAPLGSCGTVMGALKEPSAAAGTMLVLPPNDTCTFSPGRKPAPETNTVSPGFPFSTLSETNDAAVPPEVLPAPVAVEVVEGVIEVVEAEGTGAELGEVFCVEPVEVATCACATEKRRIATSKAPPATSVMGLSALVRMAQLYAQALNEG
jgi:hypothetical protein